MEEIEGTKNKKLKFKSKLLVKRLRIMENQNPPSCDKFWYLDMYHRLMITIENIEL